MDVETIDILRFMGKAHLIIEHEGVNYVALKPISDQIGLSWRRQKRVVTEEEGAILYGTKRISGPKIALLGGHMAPQNEVHIRLDRVAIYLARINTAKVRAQGNIAAANLLLNLQIEWAQALHDYETKGEARKRDELRVLDQHRKNLLAYNTLLKTLQGTEEPRYRRALAAGVEKMAEISGLPVELDLFDSTQNTNH